MTLIDRAADIFLTDPVMGTLETERDNALYFAGRIISNTAICAGLEADKVLKEYGVNSSIRAKVIMKIAGVSHESYASDDDVIV